MVTNVRPPCKNPPLELFLPSEGQHLSDIILPSTYPNEISMPGFNVEIQKVKDDAMGQIAEITIVHHQPLPGVDHLAQVSVSQRF